MKRHLLGILVVLAVSAMARADDDGDPRPYGLETRIPWTTSRVVGSPDPASAYRVERRWPALSFENPVTLTRAPGTDRMFLAQLDGRLFSFPPDQSVERADLLVDMKQFVPGLTRVYGLTFHPDFEENQYCYICYVLQDEAADGTIVSRFKVLPGETPELDPTSQEVVIRWRSGGHNGGCLKFGPDGFLYVSAGDAGPAFPPDPLSAGQDVGNVLSTIMRIDVDRPDGDRLYSIPADNPFVGIEGTRPEIWCFGLRNPWRMSFDRQTGDLWVGDVGWELWELVYRVERGANYGWSLVEGRQPVHDERTRGPAPIRPPTIEHSHIEARSITGGFVYRGRRLPELNGQYIYGDYVTGKIWAARSDNPTSAAPAKLADSPLQIICFGEDHRGEVYVVDYAGGIYWLAPNAQAAANPDFPRRLSETGLFQSTKDHRFAPGVIGYTVNAKPWADGAQSTRFVGLPGSSKIDVHQDNDPQRGILRGEWRFPDNTVLGKTLSLPTRDPAARRLETQLLHRDRHEWHAYTYIWNDDQTDALLAPAEGVEQAVELEPATADVPARTVTWRYAARSQCLVCHSSRGGTVTGFNVAQLNCDFDYGRAIDNQLRTFSHIGLFEQALADAPPRIPPPMNRSFELADRARAYLHVNCAHCHRRGGGGTAAIELLYNLPLRKTNLLGTRPTQGTFDLLDARVIAPGDPYRSVLYYRMAKLGPGHMPQFGSQVVDPGGLTLIHDWIRSLNGAEPDPERVVRQRQNEREMLEQLASDDPQADEALLSELLSTTSGAMLLATAIDGGQLRENLVPVAVERGTASPEARIRDLFERYLPENERVRRIGSAIRPEAILALDGSAERGRELFETSAGLQCRNCHRVGEVGTPTGPDLAQLAMRATRADLLESILEPSKRVDPKFVTYLVESAEGKVYSGLLVERTEMAVVLRDAQNNLVSIPPSEIEFLTTQQKSLMPELLVQDLTAQQLADLIAFLKGLADG